MSSPSSTVRLNKIENEILQLLSEFQPSGISAKDVAKKFQMEKSCVNHILYALKERNLIDCSFERPPIWRIFGRDKRVTSLPKRKHSSERTDRATSPPHRTSVSCLSEAPAPISAKVGRQERGPQVVHPTRISSRGPHPGFVEGRGQQCRLHSGRGIGSPTGRPGLSSRGRGLRPSTQSASSAPRPLPPHQLLKRAQTPHADGGHSPAQRLRVEASAEPSGVVMREMSTPPRPLMRPRFRPQHPQRLAAPQAPSPLRPRSSMVVPNEWLFPAPANIRGPVPVSIVGQVRGNVSGPVPASIPRPKPASVPGPSPVRHSIVDVVHRPLRQSFVSPRLEKEKEKEKEKELTRSNSAPGADEEALLVEVQSMASLTDLLEQQVRSLSMDTLPASDRPPPPAALLGVPATPAMLHSTRQRALLPASALDDDAAAPAAAGDADVSALSAEAMSALSKNPISVLNEFAQTRGVACSFEVIAQGGPPHRPRLEMAARVGDRFFPSISASSKKDGRREAADRALRVLLAEGLLNSLAQPKPPAPGPPSDSHGDRVAHLAHAKFAALAAGAGESLAGRKVLAAIVQRQADGGAAVVALGTGNRCVTGLNLSMDGLAVNDAHAEVVARRAFMRYLYRQVGAAAAGRDSILRRHDDDRPGRWRLKEDVSFHLYISTAPCGDGALFVSSAGRDAQSSRPDADSDEHQPTFGASVHGLLRTKIEGGEGTIPVEPGANPVQTMDGIARGERLRTMSCSDKVCRWNLLGLQGSLLSNFLQPVYLSSLTIGLLFDRGHLARGVCCRLDQGPGPNFAPDTEPTRRLPSGFRVNHPRLARVTQVEPQRELDRTSERSLNWCSGDAKAEVLDGTTGRCVEKIQGYPSVSRIAKRSLFALFREVCDAAESNELKEVCTTKTYAEAKSHCREYQTAKKLFQARFKAAKLGVWVKKPADQELFTL